MIKFFRKIRQNLIMENLPAGQAGKTGKYFKYAIGEIVLVVIGILIAVQINNWNENRKRLILEQEYYCKLFEDLNQDVVQINEKIIENENRLTSNIKFINITLQENPTQIEIINAIINTISKSTATFKLSLSAFEDLKSSGNLSLIKDKEIKNKLLTYYASLEGYTEMININSIKKLDLFFNDQKDFAEIGFQYMPKVAEVLKENAIDIKHFVPENYPSQQLIKQLKSDAIFYLAANIRKKEIYAIMLKEIKTMQDVLRKKCNNKDD